MVRARTKGNGVTRFSAKAQSESRSTQKPPIEQKRTLYRVRFLFMVMLPARQRLPAPLARMAMRPAMRVCQGNHGYRMSHCAAPRQMLPQQGLVKQPRSDFVSRQCQCRFCQWHWLQCNFVTGAQHVNDSYRQ